jgi:hypothetical protein
MTDGELVIAIQEEKISPVVLYKRYFPMILKHSRILRLSSEKDDPVEFCLDYQQEAYFIMLDAIKYVKKEHIFGPDWKFALIFSYFLRNKNRQSYLKTKRKRKKLNFRKCIDLAEADKFGLVRYKEDPLQNLLSESFYSLISPRQKEVLQYRQEGKTIKEIAGLLKLCNYTIIKEIQEAKKVASEVFCVSVT